MSKLAARARLPSRENLGQPDDHLDAPVAGPGVPRAPRTVDALERRRRPCATSHNNRKESRCSL